VERFAIEGGMRRNGFDSDAVFTSICRGYEFLTEIYQLPLQDCICERRFTPAAATTGDTTLPDAKKCFWKRDMAIA